MAITKQIQITQDDINNVAKKLDELAAVLSEREHLVLNSLFGMARQAIEAEAQADKARAAKKDSLPSLSRGFLDAFRQGVGMTFRIVDPGEDTERAQQQQQQQQQQVSRVPQQ